jgi:hypothetical protein
VLSSLLPFLLCGGTSESKTSTFRNSQFCLAEKKSQDFHIWILAILSAREDFHIWKLVISTLGYFLWLRRKWERWVIAYSFVIPFSTRANCVGSTPSADSNIL